MGCRRSVENEFDNRIKKRYTTMKTVMLESGAVLLEAKDGQFHPLEEDEFFSVHPANA